MKIVKAEDDTDLMHLSLYDDKDFTSKQDDYIKERIKDQTDNITQKELKESLTKKMTEKDLGKKPGQRGRKDPNKIKKPQYNLAKEGAIKDKYEEKTDKHSQDVEENEKDDDKGSKLQSLLKLKESFGLDHDFDADASDDDSKPQKNLSKNKKNIINQFYPENVNDNVSGNHTDFI